jgi:UTP--glucose-1-phosphate uridylyltransferase
MVLRIAASAATTVSANKKRASAPECNSPMPQAKKITKAVVPAAGFGTRMLPATKVLPKEMLPVAGKPLIQYAIEEAAASGIDTVVIVVRNHRSLIESHFAADPALDTFLRSRHQYATADDVSRLSTLVRLQFVEQHQPRGLGDAILCAKPLLDDEPFVVLLPDVIMINDEPVSAQLIRAHERNSGSFIAVRRVDLQDVERHGIVKTDKSENSGQSGSSSDAPLNITRLVEKPSPANAPSRIGIFGRYLLEPAIWNAIENTSKDARGEIQLTDALNLLCQSSPLYGLPFSGDHYDAGDRLGNLKANVELTLRDSSLRQSCLEYFADYFSSVS